MLRWRPREVGGIAVLDLMLAAVLVIGAAVTVLHQPWSGRSALDLVVSCASASVIALRRRAPYLMAAGFASGLLLLAFLGQGGSTMWAFIALLVVAFSVAEQLAPVSAAGVSGALLIAAICYDAARDTDSVAASLLSPLVIVTLPAAAGALVHRARQHSAALAALAGELAEQRDLAREAAMLTERARIARELHDVIAHTVGVMVVQAGAAERLLEVGHPARNSVHAIRQTGKEAMGELRQVIGLLRTAGDEPAAPQPGLHDLAALIDAARAAGPIRALLDTDLDLSAGAALTVYRSVQEGLTNARRHAPGAAVLVQVRGDGQRVNVIVEDDGGAPGRGDTPPGYGLIGLAERAEIYHGSISAGPRRDGTGWRLCLQLPAAGASIAFGPANVEVPVP